MSFEQGFLKDSIKRFAYYKELGDKTFEQIGDEAFFYQPSSESNSIAVIVQHLYGNMLSRWTNLLTEDGEKEWRKRDEEFEPLHHTRASVMALWEKGWSCLFGSLNSLTENDLQKTITIRTEPLTVYDAILRQLAHYPYHIGQIVYLGRLNKDKDWQSLSIPKGDSIHYLEKVTSEQKTPLPKRP
ncbi:MAG: hypothetical protein RLZZ28_2555 [Bacteroidota bacterium]